MGRVRAGMGCTRGWRVAVGWAVAVGGVAVLVGGPSGGVDAVGVGVGVAGGGGRARAGGEVETETEVVAGWVARGAGDVPAHSVGPVDVGEDEDKQWGVGLEEGDDVRHDQVDDDEDDGDEDDWDENDEDDEGVDFEEEEMNGVAASEGEITPAPEHGTGASVSAEGVRSPRVAVGAKGDALFMEMVAHLSASLEVAKGGVGSSEADLVLVLSGGLGRWAVPGDADVAGFLPRNIRAVVEAGAAGGGGPGTGAAWEAGAWQGVPDGQDAHMQMWEAFVNEAWEELLWLAPSHFDRGAPADIGPHNWGNGVGFTLKALDAVGSPPTQIVSVLAKAVRLAHSAFADRAERDSALTHMLNWAGADLTARTLPAYDAELEEMFEREEEEVEEGVAGGGDSMEGGPGVDVDPGGDAAARGGKAAASRAGEILSREILAVEAFLQEFVAAAAAMEAEQQPPQPGRPPVQEQPRPNPYHEAAHARQQERAAREQQQPLGAQHGPRQAADRRPLHQRQQVVHQPHPFQATGAQGRAQPGAAPHGGGGVGGTGADGVPHAKRQPIATLYATFSSPEVREMGNHSVVALAESVRTPGPEGRARAVKTALQAVEQAASAGNAEAQSTLGFVYGHGLLAGVFPSGWAEHVKYGRNESLALLYHTFAHHGGSIMSTLALGAAHAQGMGAEASCQSALPFYVGVADKALATYSVPGSGGQERLVRLAHRQTGEPNGDYWRLGSFPPDAPAGLWGSGDGTGGGKGPLSWLRGGGGRGGGRVGAAKDQNVLEYMKLSAANGNAGAQRALGSMYYWGARGMPRDPARAATFFHQAAAQGDAASMANLGEMYAHGIGVPKADNKTALEYFEKAAASGNVGAINGLGFMYMQGLGVDVDMAKAFDYFESAAEKGDTDAAFNAGALLLRGLGVEQDVARGVELLERAATRGHIPASFQLGSMHAGGVNGLEPSCPKAVNYLQTVAEVGPWRRRVAGRALELIGTDATVGNVLAAMTLFATAGRLGYEVGQDNTAWLLDQLGRGEEGAFVPRLPPGSYDLAALDWEEEVESWYMLAAAQGNMRASFKLGEMAAERGDTVEAAAHFTKAGERGHAEAVFNLAVLQWHGKGGLDRNLTLARILFGNSVAARPTARVGVGMYRASLELKELWRGVKESVLRALGLRPGVVEGVTAAVPAKGVESGSELDIAAGSNDHAAGSAAEEAAGSAAEVDAGSAAKEAAGSAAEEAAGLAASDADVGFFPSLLDHLRPEDAALAIAAAALGVVIALKVHLQRFVPI